MTLKLFFVDIALRKIRDTRRRKIMCRFCNKVAEKAYSFHYQAARNNSKTQQMVSSFFNSA